MYYFDILDVLETNANKYITRQEIYCLLAEKREVNFKRINEVLKNLYSTHENINRKKVGVTYFYIFIK